MRSGSRRRWNRRNSSIVAFALAIIRCRRPRTPCPFRVRHLLCNECPRTANDCRWVSFNMSYFLSLIWAPRRLPMSDQALAERRGTRLLISGSKVRVLVHPPISELKKLMKTEKFAAMGYWQRDQITFFRLVCSTVRRRGGRRRPEQRRRRVYDCGQGRRDGNVSALAFAPGFPRRFAPKRGCA